MVRQEFSISKPLKISIRDVAKYANPICETDTTIPIIEYYFSTCYSLGANHDGQDNDCSPDDKYIMSPSVGFLTEETAANSHSFSQCSVDRMRDNLLGLLDRYINNLFTIPPS